MFLFSSQKVVNTNPRCLIKTDIADNCEPTISITLGKSTFYHVNHLFSRLYIFSYQSLYADEGKKLLFKTEHLNTLEVLQEFNKIVVPLIPKEEEILGKVAGKIAAGAGTKAGGKPKATRK